MADHPADSRLLDALAQKPARVIACSGGVDSLLLADYAHEQAPGTTVVAHSVTPAVPPSATERVLRTARNLGWRLQLVESTEFADERYASNPVDRCFHCKSHLYTELEHIAGHLQGAGTLMSGANVDDLSEYRPGLDAAARHGVDHPYVRAGLGKADIRMLARRRGREWHDLPAAPCLASRLYTGTRVTAPVLRAVDAGEELVRRRTGVAVVRCRVVGSRVRVEVPAADRRRITTALLEGLRSVMRAHAPDIEEVLLDEEPYAPGRAFVHVESRPEG